MADANLTKVLLRQFYWNLIAYLDSVSRSHVCDVVEIGGRTDHLAAPVRVPETETHHHFSASDPRWTCKSTKSLIKHSCSKLFSSVCVYAKVYGVLVLMLV